MKLNVEQIKVCVVIPCRNEEAYIAPCLDSVIENDYPDQLLDIRVCDGMSTDNTRAIIRSYTKGNHNVHLMDNLEKTTPQALNLGIKSSDSDIYIILSAHATIATDYISQCVLAMASAKEYVGCVGGFMDPVYHDKRTTAIGLAMSSSFGVGNAYFRTGQKDGYVDTVVFGAYRKEVFGKAGYFDETLIRNQDDEFNYRLIKNGYKILLRRNIHSQYHVRSSLNKLFRQYYQYGFWKVVVNRKHKTVTTLRQLVPAVFVLFIIAGLIFSAFSPIGAVVFVAILLLYLILGMINAFRIKSSGINPWLILLSFWTLHISYGLGYWTGLYRIVLLGQKPGKPELTR